MEFCTGIEPMNDAFQGTHVATPSTGLDYSTTLIISINLNNKKSVMQALRIELWDQHG